MDSSVSARGRQPRVTADLQQNAALRASFAKSLAAEIADQFDTKTANRSPQTALIHDAPAIRRLAHELSQGDRQAARRDDRHPVEILGRVPDIAEVVQLNGDYPTRYGVHGAGIAALRFQTVLGRRSTLRPSTNPSLRTMPANAPVPCRPNAGRGAIAGLTPGHLTLF